MYISAFLSFCCCPSRRHFLTSPSPSNREAAGLLRFNSVDPWLQSTWFQALNLRPSRKISQLTRYPFNQGAALVANQKNQKNNVHCSALCAMVF
jgi:hypothetical protein